MRNVFIQTQNAKAFITAMKEAENMAGESVLLAFYGPAGRGKTDTSRFFAADEGWTYCRCGRGWQSSELWMLQSLCVELKVYPVPKRKKPAFEAIIDKLSLPSTAIIIDEADKMTQGHLEWIREIVDITGAPVALVGEKLLKYKMERERRVWSRTLRCIEFLPVSTKDILFFTKEATKDEKKELPGILLTAQQADMMSAAAAGDFRPVKKQVFFLEDLMRVNNASVPTDEMVKIAIKKEQKVKGDDEKKFSR